MWSYLQVTIFHSGNMVSQANVGNLDGIMAARFEAHMY